MWWEMTAAALMYPLFAARFWAAVGRPLAPEKGAIVVWTASHIETWSKCLGHLSDSQCDKGTSSAEIAWSNWLMLKECFTEGKRDALVKKAEVRWKRCRTERRTTRAEHEHENWIYNVPLEQCVLTQVLLGSVFTIWFSCLKFSANAFPPSKEKYQTIPRRSVKRSKHIAGIVGWYENRPMLFKYQSPDISSREPRYQLLWIFT